MSSKPPPTDLPIHPFASSGDFEAFLEKEHKTLPGLHVKLAKKSAGVPSITAAEAVEVALCFGWIDGRANRFDDDWWLVRYTPRRSKSIWSQKNVGTVGRLVEEGRMRPEGIIAVEAAKADGRWERAYAGPATITVPDDFAVAIAENTAAARFFEGLNKTDRYKVLWRVETAAVSTRAKRIDELIKGLTEGKVPGDTAKTTKAAPKVKGSAVREDVRKGKTVKKPAIEEEDDEADVNMPSGPIRQSRRAGLRSRT